MKVYRNIVFGAILLIGFANDVKGYGHGTLTGSGNIGVKTNHEAHKKDSGMGSLIEVSANSAGAHIVSQHEGTGVKIETHMFQNQHDSHTAEEKNIKLGGHDIKLEVGDEEKHIANHQVDKLNSGDSKLAIAPNNANHKIEDSINVQSNVEHHSQRNPKHDGNFPSYPHNGFNPNGFHEGHGGGAFIADGYHNSEYGANVPTGNNFYGPDRYDGPGGYGGPEGYSSGYNGGFVNYGNYDGHPYPVQFGRRLYRKGFNQKRYGGAGGGGFRAGGFGGYGDFPGGFPGHHVAHGGFINYPEHPGYSFGFTGFGSDVPPHGFHGNTYGPENNNGVHIVTGVSPENVGNFENKVPNAYDMVNKHNIGSGSGKNDETVGIHGPAGVHNTDGSAHHPASKIDPHGGLNIEVDKIKKGGNDELKIIQSVADIKDQLHSNGGIHKGAGIATHSTSAAGVHSTGILESSNVGATQAGHDGNVPVIHTDGVNENHFAIVANAEKGTSVSSYHTSEVGTHSAGVVLLGGLNGGEPLNNYAGHVSGIQNAHNKESNFDIGTGISNIAKGETETNSAFNKENYHKGLDIHSVKIKESQNFKGTGIGSLNFNGEGGYDATEKQIHDAKKHETQASNFEVGDIRGDIETDAVPVGALLHEQIAAKGTDFAVHTVGIGGIGTESGIAGKDIGIHRSALSQADDAILHKQIAGKGTDIAVHTVGIGGIGVESGTALKDIGIQGSALSQAESEFGGYVKKEEVNLPKGVKGGHGGEGSYGIVPGAQDGMKLEGNKGYGGYGK